MRTTFRRHRLWLKARTWLERNTPPEIAMEALHAYFHPRRGQRPRTIEALFRAMLLSLSQASMTRNVVISAMPNGVDSLAQVTGGFSPSKTARRYGQDVSRLFEDIRTRVRPRGQLRENGLWPRYCRTILSSAALLARFNSAQDFYRWIGKLRKDPIYRTALPMILSEELYGAGFAMACNILIDLGYEDFAKPDRQVRRIMEGVGLLSADASDYQALKAVVETAQECHVTPYALDKALYLIGSGQYFMHRSVKVAAKQSRTMQFLKFAGAA